MQRMTVRWHKILEKTLPAFDLIDIAAEKEFFSRKRQLAPEYSQSAYQTMLD